MLSIDQNIDKGVQFWSKHRFATLASLVLTHNTISQLNKLLVSNKQ